MAKGGRATMPADDGQRKLTAILAADVAGYSRLMADDDRETVRTLTAFREVFAEHIESRQGRIVDTAGDSVLATFESVIEAVEAAVEIQRVLGMRNQDISGHRQMHFRMGVNIGDIIVRDDGTVYGDGVNVAARLEALAEPGGVMVSEDVHRYVDGKLDVGLADAGAHEVKNIAKPVRAYRVVMDEAEEAQSSSQVFRRPKVVAGLALSIAVLIGLAVWGVTIRVEAPQMVTAEGVPTDDPRLAMPTGPTILVLPFANASDDSTQDFFVDGITEEIITALTRFRELFVIGGTTSFGYKGEQSDPVKIAQELGVRYVLDGSVRRSADKVRANVRLLDAETGANLWAESFERNLTVSDIFAIQDAITEQVVSAIADPNDGAIQRHTLNEARGTTTNSLDAYECVMFSRDYFRIQTPEVHANVRSCLEKVVEEEPDYGIAWSALAAIYSDEYTFGFNTRPNPLDRAMDAARRGADIEVEDGLSQFTLARTHAMRGELDAFFPAVEYALALNPNNATLLAAAGLYMSYPGEWERGTALVRKAIALNPHHQGWYHFPLSLNHYRLGEYDAALTEARKLKLPGFYWSHLLLAAVYGELGRQADADVAVGELRRLYPGFTTATALEELDKLNFRGPIIEQFVAGLRKAGLPDASAELTLPVIAVLPFDNMSGGPEQDYFADGITEDIITRLAQFPNILVLGRNTTFQFKGQAVDIPTIAEKLGADYVVEGSIRRGGDTVRVTAQLLGAEDGTHLWAETYDKALDAASLFAVQDEITAAIAATIGDPHGVVGEAEFRSIALQSPSQMSSYDCVLRFFEYHRLVNAESYKVARSCLEDVAEEEPNYATALAQLAIMHVDDVMLGFNLSSDSSLRTALDMLQRARAIDPRNGQVRAELAKVLVLTGDPERAVREVDEALRLSPNNSAILGRVGETLQLVGAYERAEETMARLTELNPNYPAWMNWTNVKAHLVRGEYSEAIERLEMTQMDWWYWTTAFLASAHCANGDVERGKIALETTLTAKPDLASVYWSEVYFWNKGPNVRTMFDALGTGLKACGWDVPPDPGRAAFAPTQ
jgi:adenylate cyclase